nr:MAG TPA: hypothetical protein [Caudoviricetes sp.]DAO67757.1 MAG TPA: hypothetical protein [Caudoviricetes sp.]
MAKFIAASSIVCFISFCFTQILKGAHPNERLSVKF